MTDTTTTTYPTDTFDIIDILSGIGPQQRQARRLRPAAVENAQASFEALLEGALPERYAIAAEVARLLRIPSAVDFYEDLGADEPVEQGPRLSAGLDVARLLTLAPARSSREVIGHLAQHYSDDEIVTVTQLISFLNFQLRVVTGLQALTGLSSNGLADVPVPDTSTWVAGPRVLDPHDPEPEEFVRFSLGWTPWVAPVPTEELTAEQLDALVEPSRARFPYFQLLARDPKALKARTLTDFDIFNNEDGGIDRALREFAAAATSRYNGCIYCASVHAARAVDLSGNERDVDALLANLDADLHAPGWNAVRDVAVALAKLEISPAHLTALGTDVAATIDVINAAAFFNWANRLMLVLGQPVLPERYRK